VEIKQLIESIKNPNSGETLHSEGRIVDLKVQDNNLEFTYDRTGITPEQKRKIEDVIISELEGKVSEDSITIKTVSKDSSDVYQGGSKPQEKPAQLAVGHGSSLPQKRKVDGVKKIIAVSSGKGGVGKSTVSVNLALALKNLGNKVGLLDADIYGPSIPMLLGKRDAKPVAAEDKKIAPVEAHGISFISFGNFIDEKDAVIWRGPMLGGVLNQFLFDVKWGDLDYLILDLPPGTGDVQLSMIQATNIDGVVGVSTPQDVALLDSTKGINMFAKVEVPVLGLIENMSYFAPDDMPEKKYFIFGENGAKNAAEKQGLNFLGEIPIEIALRESCDNGNPYMANNSYEGRPVWKAYIDIAKGLMESTTEKKKGFFSKILGK
jgi:ATP-binding protein involved in chromosome partitioning